MTHPRPFLRAQVSPFRHRVSLFWSDVQYWKWWPRIAALWMACVFGLFLANAFDIIEYKGRPDTAEEKCWSWGGRSDNTWNC